MYCNIYKIHINSTFQADTLLSQPTGCPYVYEDDKLICPLPLSTRSSLSQGLNGCAIWMKNFAVSQASIRIYEDNAST